MTIGDVNNDGVMDVIAGASYNASNTPDGRVHAINGENGAPLWTYPVNNTVSCVAVGDFDGDAFADVVAGSFDDNIYAIAGVDGSYLWSVTIGSLWINDVAAADVNGDGIDDVAYAHEYLAGYTNHIGVRDGIDGSVIWDLPVAYVPTRVLYGDFDADGTLDLAIGAMDELDQGWVFLRSAASGGLIWDYQIFSVEHVNGLVTLFSWDLDGNGDQDLVVGNYLGAYHVYAFDGPTASLMFTSEPLTSFPQELAFGDVTGDGALDIVCSAWDRVEVLGADDGKKLWYYSVAGLIKDVAVGDFDSDGVLDVAAGGGAEYVGTNPGKGVWALRTVYSPLLWEYVFNQYGNELTICNLNDDAYLDVVAVMSLGDAALAINGLTGQELWTWVGTENLYAVTSGDFNSDGVDEVAVAGADKRVTALGVVDKAVQWQFTTPTAQIYRKCLASSDLNGDGADDVIAGCDDGHVYAINGLTGIALWDAPSLGAVNEVELAQMNDVGPLDVVAASSTGKVWVLNGETGAVLWDYTTGGTCEHVEVLDVNGDKVNDIAAGVAPSAARVIMINGATHLEMWNVSLGLASNTHSFAHGDLSGDGLDDLVAPGNSTDRKVHALWGLTGGDLWTPFLTGDEVNCVWVQDMDGDGVNDVIAGSDDQLVYVLHGNTGVPYWQFSTSGDVMHLMVGDIAGPGRPSIACVTFDGDGTVYAFDSWYVEPGCCTLRGDYDSDGAIKVADLTQLVAYLFRGGPAPGCFEHGDIDGDGTIKVSDLTLLISYLFRSGPPPAACP